jgi:hypothetical protein
MQAGNALVWPLRVAAYNMLWVLSAPRWLGACVAAGVVAAGALVGVGYLLLRQLRLVARGRTYLEDLRDERLRKQGLLDGPAAGQGAMVNLRKVFGDGPVLMWLLPAWPSDLHTQLCVVKKRI